MRKTEWKGSRPPGKAWLAGPQAGASLEACDLRAPALQSQSPNLGSWVLFSLHRGHWGPRGVAKILSWESLVSEWLQNANSGPITTSQESCESVVLPLSREQGWAFWKSKTGGRWETTVLKNEQPRASESGSVSPQSCPTLCDPTDCSPPGSSVHGLLQARILEWVAIPFSRGFS